MTLPVLRTLRLTLRPFTLNDVQRVQQLAGSREVALNTLLIPHPYPDGAAETWIESHAEQASRGIVTFAIDDGQLVGAIGLEINADHERAEVGYWVGVPYWNRGYATEALIEVIRYAFDDLKVNRIYAYHYSRNAASGRAMQKAGMKHEGSMRQHVKKWGELLDVEWYGIVKN